MKENNKKKKLVLMLSCIGIAFILVGVTYSLVNLVFQGHREHTIDLKGISFSYEEGANGLSLTNVAPMSDTDGLASGNDYTFNVSARSSVARTIPYIIYITTDNGNTLNNEYVRINLKNTTLNSVIGPKNISELEETATNIYKITNSSFSFNGTTTNLSHNYKLTIWVNQNYVNDGSGNYNVENNEQTTTYGGETFKFKINVSTGEMTSGDFPSEGDEPDNENVNLDTSGASVPTLASNMIPVYYDNSSSTWKKADKNNYDEENQWYDYNGKMWANAVTVTKVNDTRSDLVDATPGTPIPMDRINTMWVWIPRFAASGDTANYNGGTKALPGAFNITFVDNNTTAHDAFTFGTDSLSGFWMGKFENSSDISCTAKDTVAVGSNCNLTTIRPKIIPGASIWRGAMVSTFFNDILAMSDSNNQYGFDTSADVNLDTHMLKNNEWGAVVYLTQSLYGRCTSSTSCKEVGQNNNSSYITGYGSPAGSSTSATNGTYETALGMDASTTGNIYGIYDMAGGAYDYVMGVYWNGSQYWSSGSTTTNYNSGFNGCLNEACTSKLTTGVAYPSDTKYFNLYTTSANYTSAGLQHAMIEVAGWYGDSSNFINKYPWPLRGGYISNTTVSGIFHYNNSSGNANVSRSSRSAIANG